MQLIFALVSGLLIFVPVLGLSSCSKDRGGDGWSMTEPVIEAGAVSYPVSTADRRALPFGATMKFSGSAWTSLKIESACRLGERKFSDSFSLTYRDSLLLRSLWPRTMTNTLTESELRASECSFDFLAEGADGSTQKFALSGLSLEQFVSSESDLFLRSAAVHQVAATVDHSGRLVPAKLETLVSAIDQLLASDASLNQIAMICEQSRLVLPIHTVASNSTDSRLVASEFVQKMALAGIRPCRLLASRSEADTNIFAMTIETPLRFSRVLLTTSAPESTFKVGRSELNLFRIAIENPGDEDVSITMPEAPPQMRIRAAVFQTSTDLYQGQGFFVSGTAIDDAGSTEIRQLTRISPNTYRIAAHSTAFIAFRLPAAWSGCFRFGGGIVQTSAPIVGLRYGFLKAFEIRQLDDSGEIDRLLYAVPLVTNDTYLPSSVISAEFRQQLGTEIPDYVQNQPQAVGFNECF